MASKTASFCIVSKIGANLGYKKFMRNPCARINFHHGKLFGLPYGHAAARGIDAESEGKFEWRMS
ncbi:hypothetical protein ACFPWW_18085 [Rhizobium sp. GCM10022189]